MSEEHLALLKSLVIRPSRTIPPSIEPFANALFDAGYPSGEAFNYPQVIESVE